MQGSHYIDLANWFSRSKPRRVSAQLDPFSKIDHRGAFFFDPEAWVEVTYDNGSTLSMDTREGGSPAAPGMTLICERGSIFVDVSESSAKIRKGNDETEISFEGNRLTWFENTLDALVSDQSLFTPCTVEEAIMGLEVIVAAHVSSQLGGALMDLPLDSELSSKVLRIA